MVAFVFAAFLEIVAIGVGLILNASMELGHTIIQYAVYVGGAFAALFLGFLLFFA